MRIGIALDERFDVTDARNGKGEGSGFPESKKYEIRLSNQSPSWGTFRKCSVNPSNL